MENNKNENFVVSSDSILGSSITQDLIIMEKEKDQRIKKYREFKDELTRRIEIEENLFIVIEYLNNSVLRGNPTSFLDLAEEAESLRDKILGAWNEMDGKNNE